MKIKPFGQWNIDDHWFFDHVKRIQSGSKIKASKMSINGDTAIISGSAKVPYEVTLDSCTCADFSIQGKSMPCKHIYALAIAKGYITDIKPKLSNSELKAVYDALSDDESEYNSLFSDGKIPIDIYINVMSGIVKALDNLDY